MEFHSCLRTPAQESGEATGAGLSSSRIRHLEGVLRGLAGLYQESLHHVLPTSRHTHHTRVSGSRNRDHLNISALDTRYHILAILESWAGFVVDELGGLRPKGSVPDLAHFLLSNLEWLAEQPPADEFADEIEGLRLELLRTIDSETGELRVPTRECVVTDCTGTISAPSQRVGNTDWTRIHCSAGHTWEIHEWIILRPLMEADEDPRQVRKPPRRRLVPIDAAALAAGVSEATIRKWVSRGKITRYGTPGRSEFDIDELTRITLRRRD